MNNVKHAVGIGILVLIYGVWTYQMVLPDIGVDPGLYGLAILGGIAALIGVFGRGTIKTALDMREKLK